MIRSGVLPFLACLLFVLVLALAYTVGEARRCAALTGTAGYARYCEPAR